MTQEQLMQIAAGALDVASAAPLKPNRYAFAARIPWQRIHRLRADLEAAGIDWREFKRKREFK